MYLIIIKTDFFTGPPYKDKYHVKGFFPKSVYGKKSLNDKSVVNEDQRSPIISFHRQCGSLLRFQRRTSDKTSDISVSGNGARATGAMPPVRCASQTLF